MHGAILTAPPIITSSSPPHPSRNGCYVVLQVRSYQLLLLSLFATIASADPKSPRKPAEAQANLFQLTEWSLAVTADKAGDLDAAADHYKRVVTVDQRHPDLEPLANAMWNFSDLQRRRERYTDAIKLLEGYKQLAKTDRERAAADELIADIRATPYRVWISGRPDVTAVVYIDGIRAGTAPMSRELPTGWHQIDMISANAYDQQSVESKPMTSDAVQMRTHYGTSGNVVLSASYNFRRTGSWDTDGVRYELPRRKAYAPGPHATQAWNQPSLCKPIAFDAPATGLLFVYLDAGPRPVAAGCQRVTILAQMVKLP